MEISYDNGLTTLFGLSQLPMNSYEFGGQAFTTQELWIKIAEKINVIIEHFNYLDKNFTNEKENTKEKFEYLLGEGLSEQVARIILEKIADGTLGELINETLLADIDKKVDDNKDVLGKVNLDLTNMINYNKIDLSSYVKKGLDLTDLIIEKITEGYDYFIIPKGAVLNKTLEIKNLFTGYNIRQLTFEGSGGYAEIKLNTGGIGILISGSDNVCFRNIGLSNKDVINPSTIAILQQRSAERDACQFSQFDRVYIDMKSMPTANSGNGSIGIYNNTAELATYNNISVYADIPCVLTRSDIYTLASIRRSLSMKCISFAGITTLIARKGNALVLDGVSSIDFQNLYMVKDQWEGANITQHAILLTGASETGYENYNITFTCVDNESFTSLMKITGKVRLLNLKGNQHTVNESDVITVSTNGQVINSVIDVMITSASGKTFNLINVEQSSGGIHSSEIIIPSNLAKLQSSNQINACRIFSDDEPTIIKDHSYQQFNFVFNKGGLMIGNNKVGFAYSVPPDNGKPGDIFIKTFTELGSFVGWLHDGTSYKTFGQLGYRQVSSSPIGNLEPKMIGEMILDNANKKWYKSSGLTNQDWILL